ncbi:MAG TPA: adenylosuccinate synthetase [Candidatus Saccharimonadales bacterium]|nr:adenylosuccinate synthetase [Candidatus Saccharimonadales bacterium]
MAQSPHDIEALSLAKIRQRQEEDRYDRGLLTFVVGLQYGSEGKGSIVNYLSPGVDMAVRTGAANAGHTLFYRGDTYVMRQLPAAWANPQTKLLIGAGAVISPDVLQEEIDRIDRVVPIRDRLHIDPRAHIITQEQRAREKLGNLALRIGSTSARSGDGVGAATADKVLRKESCVTAKDYKPLSHYLADTAVLVNKALENGHSVLVEGTQGFGLSLDHGHFPYVTSRDVTIGSLAASVGLSPHFCQTQVIGVARTYPIRVAGNSGPFGEDSQEMTWPEIAERAGCSEGLEERTTVTKLVRRVASFSIKEFQRSCMINRPTEITLTFADYLDWSIHAGAELTQPVYDFIQKLERSVGIPVTLVNTGPLTTVDFDNYRASMLRRLRTF